MNIDNPLNEREVYNKLAKVNKKLLSAVNMVTKGQKVLVCRGYMEVYRAILDSQIL